LIKHNDLNLKSFTSYLEKNFKKNTKILISISCGLDSTVLLNLVQNSKFFKKKNIFFVIFDHQKRAESEYEIKEFINYYKLPPSNLIIKKLNLKKSNSSFQEQSRLLRNKKIKLISKKNDISDIFLGHHLDDLNETYMLRKSQQSGVIGLSEIFSKKINNLNYHRPLVDFNKKQINEFAIKNKIRWFEDRTNLEFDYSRNKIRCFLKHNDTSRKIKNERKLYQNIISLKTLHSNFFKKIHLKKYEINVADFNNLNETLKFFVIQSFYQSLNTHYKKTLRKANISNIIEIIRNFKRNFKENSVFSGKIYKFKKKIYLNLN
tara:strand:+ start:158 stop:1114 length:957 start_codon:yes stop_codon:yes gene_type:complete